MPGPSAASLLVFGLILAVGAADHAMAEKKAASPPPVIASGMQAADKIVQTWEVSEGRLKASGTVTVTGKPGETFLLLKAPAVLTEFKGDGLRIGKRHVDGCGMVFVVSIRGAAGLGEPAAAAAVRNLNASFSFQMQVGENARTWSVPTGPAAVQDVTVVYDKSGWEFDSSEAMRIVANETAPDAQSGAQLLLAPHRSASITLRPKMRDVEAEETQFFVEVANLFLPSPGVIDARHVIRVRPSQGQVRELTLNVPEGFTVSDVAQGPVSSWQFDADAGRLHIAIEPPQARPFAVLVDTQGASGPCRRTFRCHRSRWKELRAKSAWRRSPSDRKPNRRTPRRRGCRR